MGSQIREKETEPDSEPFMPHPKAEKTSVWGWTSPKTKAQTRLALPVPGTIGARSRSPGWWWGCRADAHSFRTPVPSCPWGSLQPHLELFKVLSGPLLGKVTWSKTIPWQLFVACWALWELRHKPAKNERARHNAKKTKEEIALFTMINCQMVKIKNLPRVQKKHQLPHTQC